MNIRRVVTGARAGKSVVVSDQVIEGAAFETMPGFCNTLAWATPAIPSGDPVDPTPRVTSLIPEPGGTRLLIVTFPPDAVMASVDFDPMGAARESLEKLPGLAPLFEPDHPGMHATPTVDYDVVLEGEIWLELDDGETLHLKRGDMVVQNAVRHAWRNKSDRPATLFCVLIGAG